MTTVSAAGEGMAPKDSRATSFPAVLTDPRWRNPALAALALLALLAGALGMVLGARQDDGARPAADLPEPRRVKPEERVSFLARIIPPAPGPGSAASDVPAGVSARLQRLSLERKVAQLFLYGFTGQDPSAAGVRRPEQLDTGGIVVAGPNYAGADALRGLAAGLSRTGRGRVPPFVMTIQEGGELSSFPDLPPAEAPADLPSPREAGRQTLQSARTLSGLNVTGVLGPSLDVGLESGSALGARVYSDDPEEVAAYAKATVRAHESARVFSAAKHFPGLGSADQSTQDGPATVGLDLPELRERDLIPFRTAIDSGVPGIVLSNALYPFSDFTVPASLSPRVGRDLLRDELGFDGVAITDDLSDPAITALTTVPAAAVEALRAGADMLFISGPEGDQRAAYAAVLSAVRAGRISRDRVDEAVERILMAKRRYRVLR
jgi:beta-N-acetylhexosaminidase